MLQGQAVPAGTICRMTHLLPNCGNLSGNAPWQCKYFLVLSCHSPTQHLQKDGVSLPSESVSPSVVLFSLSCALLSALRFSAQSQTNSCPRAGINHGWPGPRSLCPQHALNPASLLHPHLFYFNLLLFFKISLEVICSFFNAKSVPTFSMYNGMRNSIDSSKKWPKYSVGM